MNFRLKRQATRCVQDAIRCTNLWMHPDPMFRISTRIVGLLTVRAVHRLKILSPLLPTRRHASRPLLRMLTNPTSPYWRYSKTNWLSSHPMRKSRSQVKGLTLPRHWCRRKTRSHDVSLKPAVCLTPSIVQMDKIPFLCRGAKTDIGCLKRTVGKRR